VGGENPVSQMRYSPHREFVW